MNSTYAQTALTQLQSIHPAETFPFQLQIKHLPLKRIFDLFFSLFILITCSPLFLFIALLIKCSSKGPIIFSHLRIGRGGHPFKCYKFRTMYVDADQRLHKLIANDPKLNEEWKMTHKLKKDPRITPLGRILRKYSLDELPQFFNVIKGDLSVVGPRAVVKEELEKHYKESASQVLSIRPGITGLWQVSGRSNLSYRQRVKLDRFYVKKRSLLFDFFLILKTIPAMLSARGAY